jgi:hypothetical protein
MLSACIHHTARGPGRYTLMYMVMGKYTCGAAGEQQADQPASSAAGAAIVSAGTGVVLATAQAVQAGSAPLQARTPSPRLWHSGGEHKA